MRKKRRKKKRKNITKYKGITNNSRPVGPYEAVYDKTTLFSLK